MKAYAIKKYGTISDIEQIEIDCPAIGNQDVRVRVKSAAINPADLKVITGKNGGKFIHSGRSPIGLGFDFSGIIEKTGREVTLLNRGDAVFGFLPYARKTVQGSFADYVVVKSGTIAKKPSSIPHTEAATAATTGSTALQALVDIGGIKPGQKVLINGASGGVGTFAVQIARSFEVEVWGTCSAKNIDYLKSIGVEQALDYRQKSLKDLDETFDIILDAVSKASFNECKRILAPNGTYITLLPSFGYVTGKIQSIFSSRKCAACYVQPRSADLGRLATMIEEKVIKTPVAKVFPVAELQKALEKYIAGGVRGKIGITIEE
jgi:NADPH:quinone reductase-like Zn-dependent oxidoreductase